MSRFATDLFNDSRIHDLQHRFSLNGAISDSISLAWIMTARNAMNERTTASACVVIRRATVIHVLGLWLFVFRVIMMNNKPTISASHLNDARLEWIPIKCERNARCSELCRDYRSLFVDVSRTNCAFFWAAAQRQVAIAGELTNKPSNHIPKRDDQVNILLLWIIIF